MGGVAFPQAPLVWALEFRDRDQLWRMSPVTQRHPAGQ